MFVTCLDSHKQKEQGMQVKAVTVKNNREGTIQPNLTESDVFLLLRILN